MKIITVSMIKNEQDIVETFVRYHARIVDEMILLDNGSVDGTPDILSLLQQEGLPVRLHFDPCPVYLQAQSVTTMVNEAFLERGASLVLPLDVDEFLDSGLASDIRRELETLPEKDVSTMEWVTYVPTPHDDPLEPDPLARIVHRRAVQHNHDVKVAIPAAVWAHHPGATVTQGSHSVATLEGGLLPGKAAGDRLRLAHFPLRSPRQMRAKYLVGWLANLARPDRVLFDWLPLYHLSKSGTPSLEELCTAALTYNILDKSVEPGLVRDPLSSGPQGWLRHTPATIYEPMSLVLSLAEELADLVSLGLGRSLPGGSQLSDQEVFNRIESFRTIGGWLSPREAATLFRVAVSLDAIAPVVCEIGSWRGKSSYVLAKALQDRPDAGSLVCIDPFDGSGDESSRRVYQKEIAAMKDDPEGLFWSNLRSRGVHQVVRLLRGRSTEVLEQAPRRIDMLFIDGDHSYSAVRHDFDTYSPRIPTGGVIAFHDVGSTKFTGPRQVVESCVVPSPDWTEHRLVDELFIARRA